MEVNFVKETLPLNKQKKNSEPVNTSSFSMVFICSSAVKTNPSNSVVVKFPPSLVKPFRAWKNGVWKVQKSHIQTRKQWKFFGISFATG